VEFSYSAGNDSGFAQACSEVLVEGEVRPIDADGDSVVDCGRGDGADVTLMTVVDGTTFDQHDLTSAELTGAVQVVVGKAANRTGQAVDFGETCSAVCDALYASARKGNCPEFQGSAVAVSWNALTTAMNTVDEQLAVTLDSGQTGLLDGAWCWVSTHPDHLAPSSSGTQAPVNIWWGVIYGLKNYSAGSLVYSGSGDNPLVAVYGLTYKVPGKVANQFAGFLANPLTATYPSGSTFSLVPQSAKYSENGTTTTSGGWPGWWKAPAGTGIIDPKFDDAITGSEGLDAFIAAHAGAGTVAEQEECPVSTGFPTDYPTGLIGDTGANNESITLDEGCPEAP
jgi:hypothetical protein